MPLSPDKQLLLCHQLFGPLESPRVDALLSGCLASVRREMTAAGFRVSEELMSSAGMGAGSCSRARRAACVDAHEGADGRGPAVSVTVELTVDVGETGTTPRMLALEMSAHRMTGAAFATSPKVLAILNAQAVDSMDGQLAFEGALNRLYGGVQVEAARAADLAREFCAQLGEELVP